MSFWLHLRTRTFPASEIASQTAYKTYSPPRGTVSPGSYARPYTIRKRNLSKQPGDRVKSEASRTQTNLGVVEMSHDHTCSTYPRQAPG